MKFLILAIDHDWQLAPPGLKEKWPKEHTRLREVATKGIDSCTIDLVCEESDPRYLSIVQKMAYERNPRIRWKNIIMTSQERLEAGIYEALLNRPYDTVEIEAGYFREVLHRIPEDTVREQFFCDQIVQAANTSGSKNVLVLCGDMHADFLKDLLIKAGHEGKASHDLVPQKLWK